MTEVTRIRVVIDSDQANSQLRRLRSNMAEFDQHARRSTRSVRQLGSESSSIFSGIGASVAAAAAGFAAFQVGSELFSTISEFEKLNAVLKTIEGSAAGGERAFRMIQDFTKTTPFQLQEVTKAYQILKTRGIEPTTEVLKSFGNISAAMGRDIEQFAEAVADAITGEFERLKEFGIRASKEGDQISFTFKGVTTTVRDSAEEIQNYLKSIGEVEFAGAMTEQMNTIGGIVSNIKDQFSALAYEIGEGGLKDALKDLLRTFLDIISISAETARSIGSGLASAVRLVNDTFVYLKDNINLSSNELKYFGAAIAGLVGGGAVSLLAKSIGFIVRSIGSLARLLAKNPLGLLVSGLAVAGTAAVDYVKKLAEARGEQVSFIAILQATYNVISTNIKNAFAAMLDWISKLSGGILNMDSVFANMVNGWGIGLDSIASAAKQMYNVFVAVGASIIDTFTYVGNKLAEVMLKPINFIIDSLNALISWAGPFIKDNIGVELGQMGKIAWEGFSTNFMEGMRNSELGSQILENFERDWAGEHVQVFKGFGDTVAEEALRIQQEMDAASESVGEDLTEMSNPAKNLEQTMRDLGETTGETAGSTKELSEEAEKLADANFKLLTGLAEREAVLRAEIALYGRSKEEIQDYLTIQQAEANGIGRVVSERIKVINSLRDELRQKAFNSDFNGYIESLKFETQALYLNRQERERVLALHQWELKAKEQGVNLTQAQREEFNRTWEAHREAQEQAQERDRLEEERRRDLIATEKEYQDTILGTGDAYKKSTDVAISSANRLENSLTKLFSNLTGDKTVGGILGNIGGWILNEIRGKNQDSFGEKIFDMIDIGEIFKGNFDLDDIISPSNPNKKIELSDRRIIANDNEKIRTTSGGSSRTLNINVNVTGDGQNTEVSEGIVQEIKDFINKEVKGLIDIQIADELSFGGLFNLR